MRFMPASFVARFLMAAVLVAGFACQSQAAPPRSYRRAYDNHYSPHHRTYAQRYGLYQNGSYARRNGLYSNRTYAQRYGFPPPRFLFPKVRPVLLRLRSVPPPVSGSELVLALLRSAGPWVRHAGGVPPRLRLLRLLRVPRLPLVMTGAPSNHDPLASSRTPTRMSYAACAPTVIPKPRSTNSPAKNSPAIARNVKLNSANGSPPSPM